MEPPTVTATIVEDNATRAELYGHWLDHMAVRVAVTKRQVVEAIDDEVTVVILAEEFGDEAAETVLDLVRSRTTYCQVLTTSENRSKVVPDLDVSNHLAKPIFKEDLRERVEGLARQTVYAQLLDSYYRATAMETALRNSEDPADAEERVERLTDRIEDLKPMLAGIRAELDQDDVSRVGDLLTREHDGDAAESGQQSKYVPQKCFNCGQSWSVSSGAGRDNGVVRLGSHVWRCTNCGHIQLGGTAGNPRLTHSG
jgi:rubrerythrin